MCLVKIEQVCSSTVSVGGRVGGGGSRNDGGVGGVSGGSSRVCFLKRLLIPTPPAFPTIRTTLFLYLTSLGPSQSNEKRGGKKNWHFISEHRRASGIVLLPREQGGARSEKSTTN